MLTQHCPFLMGVVVQTRTGNDPVPLDSPVVSQGLAYMMHMHVDTIYGTSVPFSPSVAVQPRGSAKAGQYWDCMQLTWAASYHGVI